MTTLKRLLAEHKKLKLPEFPQDDKFSEWVEELIETDAYYVGLVSTLSEGGKVRLNNIALNQMRNKLTAFKDSDEQEIYDDCTNYLNSLDRLVSSALNQNN
jgi:hypothetical protein